MPRKLTTQEFIEKAKQVHGDKYDYSKVDYINSSTKIIIICPIHGQFEQRPNDHLSGKGCPNCSATRKITKEIFLTKATQVHQNKYTYNMDSFTTGSGSIEVICPDHGSFTQKVYNHLQGKGCPLCTYSKLRSKLTKDSQDFINQCNQVHNNYYDYSKVEYSNNKTKICIICPIHGEFWQLPKDHLKGCGCPKCNKSHGETQIENYLITNNIKYISQYEIPIDISINKSGKAFIDFYLPDYNTCLEYNGQQHYISSYNFGGNFNFEKQKNRDSFVRNYCAQHNIKLLEISYKDNIIESLITFLNSQQ